MDKALVFGTKDYRFESCQDHLVYTVGSGQVRHIVVASWQEEQVVLPISCLSCVRLSASA